MSSAAASIFTPRVAVVQDGARLHYAVPLALRRAGMLEMMFTEWYLRPWSLAAGVSRLARVISRNPEARRADERRHPELAGADIRTYPGLAIKQRLGRRKHPFVEAYFAWASSLVGARVQRDLPRLAKDANTLFGFVRNIDPALCEFARERGMQVVTDQMIAPMAEEERQAAIQQQRWPGWQAMTPSAGAALVRQTEERTWRAATHITCASNYVRDTLMQQSVSGERVSVLPYPIDASHYKFLDRSSRQGPVTVGFVGGVGLRKGAPYFFEVARRLASPMLRFVMVGPVQLDAKVAGERRGAVELVGVVPRSQVATHLARFDILLFPSTCEGSAGAVMEAMATGLPVVTTPNAGSVIRNGRDGFIHSYDDIEALSASIERLAGDASARQSMGRAARERAEFFDLDQYSGALAGLLRSLPDARQPLQ